jgi:Ca2+-binding RTX toxin-like protein
MYKMYNCSGQDLTDTATGTIQNDDTSLAIAPTNEVIVKLSGNQNWGRNYNNYTTGEGWKAYTVNVGDYVTGNFNYLTLVNDHDVANPTANSQFRNLKIYEANIIKGTRSNDTLTGSNGKDILVGLGGNDVLV